MRTFAQISICSALVLMTACADKNGGAGGSSGDGDFGTDPSAESGATCELSADDHVTCTIPGELETCTEYRFDPTFMEAADIAELEASCNRTDGAVFERNSQCPDSADLVGHCVLTVPHSEQSSMVTFYYTDNPTESARVQLGCEMVGDQYGDEATVMWCPA